MVSKKLLAVGGNDCALCSTPIRYKIVTECSCGSQSIPSDVGTAVGGYTTPLDLFNALKKYLGQ